MKKKTRDIIVESVKMWNHDNSFEIVISNDWKGFNVEKSFDTKIFKQYGIEDFSDSLEFMENDYFKDAHLVCYVDSQCDVLAVIEDHPQFIIKKVRSQS